MPIIRTLAGVHIKVVMDGNSLTRGFNGASVNQYISNKITEYLTPLVGSVEMVSLGVDGQRLQTMVNNATANIYSLVNPSKYNILIVNEDANGIFQDDYSEFKNLQLMNQYISGAYRSKFDAIISWNGWYARTPFDLFIPTTDDLLRFKNYCDLANTEGKLYSNINVDMRLCANVGGAEGQAQNSTYFNDYLHLKALGYDEVANRLITHGINQLFTF